MGNTADDVSQCACGAWFRKHESGQCRDCRNKPKPKPRRRKQGERRPAAGTQEWAETRDDDLGESGDY